MNTDQHQFTAETQRLGELFRGRVGEHMMRDEIPQDIRRLLAHACVFMAERVDNQWEANVGMSRVNHAVELPNDPRSVNLIRVGESGSQQRQRWLTDAAERVDGFGRSLRPSVMQHRFKPGNGACRIGSKKKKRSGSIFDTLSRSSKARFDEMAVRVPMPEPIVEPLAPSRFVLEPIEQTRQGFSAYRPDCCRGFGFPHTVLSSCFVAVEPFRKLSSLVFGLSPPQHGKTHSHNGNQAEDDQHHSTCQPHARMMEVLRGRARGLKPRMNTNQHQVTAETRRHLTPALSPLLRRLRNAEREELR